MCRYTALWNVNVRKLVEIWNMYDKWLNDKWEGSIVKHLSCDALLHYKYVKEIKIGEHLAKLQAKWLIVPHLP